MEDPLSKAQARINKLKDEITAKIKIIGEHEQKEKKLQEELDAANKTIAQQLKEMDQREKQTRDAAIKHEKQVAALQQQQQAFQDEKAAFAAEQLAVQDQISSLNSTISSLQTQLAQSQQTIESLNASNLIETSTFQSQLTALQTSNLESAATFNRIQLKLETDLQSKHRELIEEDEKRKELESVIEELKQDISKLNHEKEKIIENAVKAQAVLEQKMVEMGRKHQQQLDAIYADTRKTIDNIKQNMVLSEEKLDKLKAFEERRTAMETELRSNREQISDLRKQLEAKTKSLTVLSNESHSTITSLQQQLSSLQEENKKVKAELQLKVKALKVYHEAAEQNQKLKIQKEKEAEQQSKKSSGSSFFSAFKNLTTSSSSSSSNSSSANGANLTASSSSRDNLHSSNNSLTTTGSLTSTSGVGSSGSRGVEADLEEELSVALNARVEKLTLEREEQRLEIEALKKTLKQEQFLCNQFKQQILAESRKGSSNTPVKETPLKASEKAHLEKLLTETIESKKALEEQRAKDSAELKRLQGQLRVKTGEIEELKTQMAQLP